MGKRCWKWSNWKEEKWNHRWLSLPNTDIVQDPNFCPGVPIFIFLGHIHQYPCPFTSRNPNINALFIMGLVLTKLASTGRQAANCRSSHAML